MATQHPCATPPTGWPGDEWTCPVCDQTWWADDCDDDMTITWEPVEEPTAEEEQAAMDWLANRNRGSGPK
jgi:hypothetical protein